MSAHLLLNVLNKLGKRDKMWGLPSFLSLFSNKLNKFNKQIQWYMSTHVRSSIYRMTVRHYFEIKFLACYYVRNINP